VTAWAAFLRADLRRIRRDPMLVMMFVSPLLGALAMRPLWPWTVQRATTLQPAVIEGLFTAVLLLVTPLMFGFVVGLMLLDDRDEGALAAVALTPTGRPGFLMRRLALPVLWCVPVSFAVTWLAGLPLVHPLRFTAIAGLAGLETPLLALFMTAFGGNKLEGIAMSKVASALLTWGGLALLLEPPLNWSGAPAPGWWLIRLLFARSLPAPEFTLLFAGGLVVHLLVLFVLLEVFRRRTT